MAVGAPLLVRISLCHLLLYFDRASGVFGSTLYFQAEGRPDSHSRYSASRLRASCKISCNSRRFVGGGALRFVSCHIACNCVAFQIKRTTKVPEPLERVGRYLRTAGASCTGIGGILAVCKLASSCHQNVSSHYKGSRW
jgi:hypothetical protein